MDVNEQFLPQLESAGPGPIDAPLLYDDRAQGSSAAAMP